MGGCTAESDSNTNVQEVLNYFFNWLFDLLNECVSALKGQLGESLNVVCADAFVPYRHFKHSQSPPVDGLFPYYHFSVFILKNFFANVDVSRRSDLRIRMTTFDSR